MTDSQKKLFVLLLLGALLGFEAPANAFEQVTHTQMSVVAARQSTLGNLLAWNLPEFWQGLDQKIDDHSVETLIGDGAHEEDEPDTQVVYHFHDPTRPWSDAGLLGGSFPSSIRRQQAVFVPYMWHSAREDYLNALLEADPGDRLRLFSETFKSLGHIIHFVQDAASPAHTRDDPHPPWDTDRLHAWAAVNDSAVAANGNLFSGDLTTPTLDLVASRPVARIIDATEDDRGEPAWSTAIGVAEYSNSQFLSAWLRRNDDDDRPADPLPGALGLNRRAPDVVTVRGWRGYNVLAHVTPGVNECGAAGLEDQPPGLGAVVALDATRVVLRRVLSDAERASLAARGYAQYGARDLEVIREDLAIRLVPIR